MKSLQYDRKRHALVRDPRPTYVLSVGYIRVSYVLNGPPAGVLRLHRRANTCILLGHNFWACSKLVCWQIGLACTLTGKSGRYPCEILTGACFSVGKCKQTVHIICCKWSQWYEMQLTKLGTFQYQLVPWYMASVLLVRYTISAAKIQNATVHSVIILGTERNSWHPILSCILYCIIYTSFSKIYCRN